MSEKLSSEQFPPKPHGSVAAKLPGLLFCGGQIGQGEIKEATLKALTNLKAVLELGGSTLEDVAKVNIFLKNMDDFEAMNSVYTTFMPTPKPARTCIQAGRLPGGETTAIEIECIARA
ncbi:hypothetical protein L198_08230 [Cryptococcus wingfieldii CBS 7118]|uniref:Uncharacterized protein n=1 Tax=Cryptococcus wingfieldii CBS 7118 TaxID=1295528 RepID=A0A1E3HD72_9TREE|nr:hypothetical protein L198_08230 [Cryptococcus wingfieldii CBS 7118]ODN74299.1 hypothetical protein L198_08230 [Cryptococcus wingfieldii CBS 7118]